MKKLFLLFAFGCLMNLAKAENQDSLWFVNNYTKIEQQIPMRDGILLFTSIYVPKDNLEKHPFLITRTPYSCRPYGEGKFPPFWIINA